MMRRFVLYGVLALVLLTLGVFAVRTGGGHNAMAMYEEALASLENGESERAAYLLDVLRMDRDFCAYLQERTDCRPLASLMAEVQFRRAESAASTDLPLLTMPPARTAAMPTSVAATKPVSAPVQTPRTTATPKPTKTSRPTATPRITVPRTPGQFTDMTVDLKLSLFTDTAAGKGRTQSYSAADIRQYMYHGNHYPYTVYFDFASSVRQREYACKITVQDPRGGVQTLISGTARIAPGDTRVYWSNNCFDDYFLGLYRSYGNIPTGSYTLTLYLDGKTADTVRFSVKN